MATHNLALATQLGSFLRDARLQRGLTQPMMAKKLGISTQAYSRLERNAERAAFERIFRVCRLLDLRIAIADGARPSKTRLEW